MSTALDASSNRAQLEEERSRLTARLHDRPQDTRATDQLRRVSAALAAVTTQRGETEPERLRRSGLSFFDRVREWRDRRRSTVNSPAKSR
jgi:hypothetical protein